MAYPWGVDWSDWQSNANIPAYLAAGPAYAMVKASEGTTYTSPSFGTHWRQLAGKIKRGAYHFARPSYGNSAAAEADHFVFSAQTWGFGPGDFAMLDYEDDGAWGGNWTQWGVDFCAAVQAGLGLSDSQMWVYTGAWWSSPRGLTGASGLGKYPLVLASYTSNPPGPLPGWDRVSVWQQADAATVPGFSGPVDLNYVLDPAALGGGIKKPSPAVLMEIV